MAIISGASFRGGDLGTSYVTKQPVLDEILARMPTTMILAGLSVVFSVTLGVILGVLAATWQNSIIDYFSTFLSLIGVSMPNFWQGLMNIIIFAIALGWFPVSGFYGPRYWVLPVLTVGTSSMATITRTTRSSMLEVIRTDYIRHRPRQGQTEVQGHRRPRAEDALIPNITVAGLQFGGLLGGACSPSPYSPSLAWASSCLTPSASATTPSSWAACCCRPRSTASSTWWWT